MSFTQRINEPAVKRMLASELNKLGIEFLGGSMDQGFSGGGYIRGKVRIGENDFEIHDYFMSLDSLESCKAAAEFIRKKYGEQPEPSKVITLDGKELKHPEPHQGLIAQLEHLLASARSGELQAIIYACQHDDGCSSRGTQGAVKNRYTLYGAITAEANEYWENNLRG